MVDGPRITSIPIQVTVQEIIVAPDALDELPTTLFRGVLFYLILGTILTIFVAGFLLFYGSWLPAMILIAFWAVGVINVIAFLHIWDSRDAQFARRTAREVKEALEK